jgi:predicted RND superfamily exporter protein
MYNKGFSKYYLVNCLKHPGRLTVVSGIITIAAIFQLNKLEVNNSIEIWFHPSDSSLINYLDFRNDFGSDAYITIFYRNEDLFTKEGIGIHKSLTDELSALSNVEYVISLTNIRIPRMIIGKVVLVPLLDPESGNLNRIRHEITKHPIFIDNVISRDGNATGMTLSIKDPESIETLEQIREILQKDLYSRNVYYLANSVPIRHEMNLLSQKESIKFLVICIIILFSLLFLRFRTAGIAILPVIIALLTVIWTMAGYAAAGFQISMISGPIPLILMVISIAVSIHLLVGFQKEYRRCKDRLEALKTTVRKLYLPCLFSVLTTAVAFLAFMSTSLVPIRIFGLAAACGILLSYGLNFTLIPALLSLYNPGRLSLSPQFCRVSSKTYVNLSGWVKKRRDYILILVLCIFSLAILGISKLSVETDQIKYFRKSNPIRYANERAKEWFDGILTLELVINDQNGDLGDFLQLINLIEKDLLQFREVAVCHSPVGLLKSICSFLGLSYEDYGEAIALALLNPSDDNDHRNFINRYMTPSGRRARLSVKTGWMSNEETRVLMKQFNRTLRPRFEDPSGAYLFTGLLPVFYDVNERLMINQARSIIISFVLIFIMILILFRSIYFAVIGMIPNILPVITSLGIMGWSGVKIDVMTVSIASISLGIAIDDTIHFINAYKGIYTGNKDFPGIISSVYSSVAEPITLTSIFLCTGFLVLLFSSFAPLLYFGIFVSLNVLFALLYDLLVLPAVISYTLK